MLGNMEVRRGGTKLPGIEGRDIQNNKENSYLVFCTKMRKPHLCVCSSIQGILLTTIFISYIRKMISVIVITTYLYKCIYIFQDNKK